MSRLQLDHPDLYNFFDHGEFPVQLCSKNLFARIPIDEAIEVTVNRDTQTPGGTKGFSLQAAPLEKYYIGAEFRSASVRDLRQMTNNVTSRNCFHNSPAATELYLVLRYYVFFLWILFP